jgi:hypothetical protein
MCSYLTINSTLCIAKATEFREGLLPVCTKHVHERIKMGACQAVETCGKLCLRLSRADPPFHLCSLHAKGTDTLPCYILKIPVELRLMIFRDVLPSNVEALKPTEIVRDRKRGQSRWEIKATRIHSYRINTSVLKLNRQLCAEACSVLYGETLFHIKVGITYVAFMGMIWHYESFNWKGRFDISKQRPCTKCM